MGLLNKIVLICLILYKDGSQGAYSRYSGTSRFQLPLQLVSCNNTNQQVEKNVPYYSALAQGSLPLALSLSSQVPAGGAGNEYFTPTILTNFPQGAQPSSENENDIDIGNRISIPSSMSQSTQQTRGTATVWMPHRLNLPNRMTSWQKESIQNLLTSEERSKIYDLGNRVINCEPTCPYSIVKYFADSQYENLMLGLKFYLFTRENPIRSEEFVIYQNKSLEGSKFSPKRATKIIIHGFTDVDAEGEWINSLKEAYLSVSDVNVLVADYSSFSLQLLFRTNLPIFASKRLAEMIMWLETDAAASGDMFHIVARSYGCHIAGMTGRLLGGTLGRITALEPADKIAIDGSPEYKVTKEDAQFVDAIHVNGKRFFFHGAQFGIQNPVGHVDVYPNIVEKGLGCPGESLSLRRYSLRFCQLGRGVRYFTNSIKYPDSFPMCQCESFEHYKTGMCSCSQQRISVFMGENISKRTRGIYQLVSIPQQNPLFTNFRYYSRPIVG